jgi:hypothetical protein
MIQGETPQKELFGIVKNSFEFLKNIKEELVSEFEVLTILRILNELGYVVRDSLTQDFLTEEWNETVLQKVKENKKEIVGVINKALRASHL